MPPAEHEVQVLAVGASAAGLRSSLALSRYGFRHVLVERHRGTAHTPRPHILNQRTVETLRHFGIDDRFHAAATPQESVRINLWVTTLFGKVARRDAGDPYPTERRSPSRPAHA